MNLFWPHVETRKEISHVLEDNVQYSIMGFTVDNTVYNIVYIIKAVTLSTVTIAHIVSQLIFHKTPSFILLFMLHRLHATIKLVTRT